MVVIDDDNNATLLIHEGVKIKEEYEKTDVVSDLDSMDNDGSKSSWDESKMD